MKKKMIKRSDVSEIKKTNKKFEISKFLKLAKEVKIAVRKEEKKYGRITDNPDFI